MNKIITLLGFMTMILLIGMNSHAIYDEMSAQGKLKNTSTGDAMVGDFAFSFNIYDSFIGGSSLYEHNETLTTDSNGIYNVILTSVDLPFNVNYYLGININDTGEMSPRVNMTDVGNAIRSNETEYFNNQISSYYLNTSTTFEGDISGAYDAISLDTDTVSDNEIDYLTVTLNDFTNDASFVTTSDDSVSSSELDNICNTNDRILLRAAGSWGCFDYSVWATDNEVTTANTSMKNYVDARDSLQDACSEITGCIENAITDGNTNWDNSYGYFDDIANFTGTLTDTKWCVYDSANTEIDCNVEPVTDTDTQDLSYTAATDVISLVDGGSIDITEVDTSANTICSGETTYLDGDGNCDDISSVYRLQSWDNFTGIPTAAPTDGDTTHLSTADQIRDYVIGLGYSTTTGTVTSIATTAPISGGTITSTGTISLSTATPSNGDTTHASTADQIYDWGVAAFQPLESTLTDIADGTITENLVNTANPWADNEVSDTLTCSDLVSGSAVVDISTETNLAVGNGITITDDTLTVVGGTAITADAGGVSVTADAIGDTQLEFNTGQHLATTNSPTFQNVTVEGIHFENDATHIIDDNATCIIITGDTSTFNIC